MRSARNSRNNFSNLTSRTKRMTFNLLNASLDDKYPTSSNGSTETKSTANQVRKYSFAICECVVGVHRVPSFPALGSGRAKLIKISATNTTSTSRLTTNKSPSSTSVNTTSNGVTTLQYNRENRRMTSHTAMKPPSGSIIMLRGARALRKTVDCSDWDNPCQVPFGPRYRRASSFRSKCLGMYRLDCLRTPVFVGSGARTCARS
mmetsp:Transcript_86571/g.232118  ORF Transcript_86571/g.232118 Transcript_86571/m.232118 type:complete len:204 (-) Transcript_86571:60-671(-)